MFTRWSSQGPAGPGVWAPVTTQGPPRRPPQPQQTTDRAPLTRTLSNTPHPHGRAGNGTPSTEQHDPHSTSHGPQRPLVGPHARANERSNTHRPHGRAGDDPPSHSAKGRTGDCPGPCEETNEGRTATRGRRGGGQIVFSLTAFSASPPPPKGCGPLLRRGAHHSTAGLPSSDPACLPPPPRAVPGAACGSPRRSCAPL